MQNLQELLNNNFLPLNSLVCYITKGSKCAIHGRINTGSYTNQEGQKRYTTDVIADRIEFLDSKTQGQAKPTQDSNHFSDFPDDDEDIFQPVDDEEIPF